MISLRFLRSARVEERWFWRAAFAGLLVFGAALRIIEVTYDRFDYDEYALMVGVDKSLPEFAGLHQFFGIQFLVHYWLSYRFLGGSLTAFRSMPLLAGVVLLIATVLLLRRAWPSQKMVTLVVLPILILNADALFLTRYAMFAYGTTFLLSAGLYFLFMKLAEGPIEGRRWLWITVVLLPAALFSNEFLMVPLAAGALSVLVLRWSRSIGAANLGLLWRWIWELKPLLIFPIVYAVRQILHSTTAHWGPEARIDQVDLYFPTSGYARTLVGVVNFLLSKTYSLYSSVLTPSGISDRPTLGALFLACCAFLAGLALVQVAKRRADGRTVFTVLFLLTALTSTAIGGLLGLYPYGIARYTPFVFLPTAALIGIGGSLADSWVLEDLRLRHLWNAFLPWLVTAALIAGAYLCVVRAAEIAKIQEDDAHAIAWLQSRQPDMTLADPYLASILYTKAPAIYDRLYDMGWGTYYDVDVVPSELAKVVTGRGQSKPIETILVVLYPNELGRTDPYEGFAQRHPNWSKLIDANFDLVASVESLHIEGRFYQRK